MNKIRKVRFWCLSSFETGALQWHKYYENLIARVIIWLNLVGSSPRELSSNYMYILREYLKMSNRPLQIETLVLCVDEILPSLSVLANCDTI